MTRQEDKTTLLSQPGASSYSSIEPSRVTVPDSIDGDSTTTDAQTDTYETRKQILNVPPVTMLIMFTSLSFFLYVDRGVFSALIDDVKSAFHMNNLKAGICLSAYLVCYCVSGPIFAQIAKYRTPLRLCSLGMLVWVIAVVLSGLSVDFVTLMLARALTGVGEASFLVMAAPMIDYFAPPAKRSTWLAIYYSAIPIGYAGGAIMGSVISSSKVLGDKWTWRGVYFLEGIIVLPCVLLFSRIRGPKSMQEISPPQDRQLQNKTTVQAFLDDVKALLRNPLYVTIVLGYAMQTFFVGAVALYAISYLKKVFHLSGKSAGSIFGAITASTGLGGSAIGGIILDWIKPRSPTASQAEREVAAHKIMVVSALLATPASMFAFVMHSLGTFVPLLVVGEVMVFMSTGPINSAILWCVPIPLQPTALAMSNLTIHILGDALSPVVIGALVDKIKIRTALFIASGFLGLSALFFIVGLMKSGVALARERAKAKSEGELSMATS